MKFEKTRFSFQYFLATRVKTVEKMFGNYMLLNYAGEYTKDSKII